jgi:hypothetical protein
MLEYTVQKKYDVKDKYFEFLFIRSGHLLRLQCWTLSALFDDYKPLFYTMVRQIELKKEPATYGTPWNLPDSLMFCNAIKFIKVNYSPSNMDVYGNLCVDSSRSLCWKIQSPTNTVYILGSIHLAKPEIYPLKQSVENAFNSCKVLAVEVNIESKSFKKELNKRMKQFRYPSDQTIQDHISEDSYENLQKAMRSVGMSLTLFSSFHPWILGVSLEHMKYQKMGIVPEYGLDRHFLDKANDSMGKKEIVEIEKADDHFKLISEYCDNELYLAYVLFGLDQLERQITPALAAWKCGNATLIEKLILTDDSTIHPEFEGLVEKLVYNRNEIMANKISLYLQDNRDYFVVFGCGHAVGPKGVISLLSKKGYKVEQL